MRTYPKRESLYSLFRGAAGLLVVALVAAGCSADPDDSESESGQDEQAQAGETEADGEGESGAPADGFDTSGEPVEVRFTSHLPSGSINEQVGWFADEVESRSGGRVTVDPFFDGSLMGGGEVLSAIQDGRVDAGHITGAYWPAEMPLWNVGSIPFLTSDSGAYMAAYRDLRDNNEAFRQELEDVGLEMLFFFPLGPAAAGTREPVDSLADLEGLRLRTVGEVAYAMEQVGIEPVAQDPAETYESLQRGVLDGFGAIIFDIIPPLGLHEVAPYVLDPGTGQYAIAGVGISRDVMASYPEDVQQLLREVGEDSMDDYAIEMLMRLEEEACDTILADGGTVSQLPESEVAAWEEQVGDSVVERWREQSVESGASEEEVQSVWDDFNQALEANSPSEYEHGMEKCAARS